MGLRAETHAESSQLFEERERWNWPVRSVRFWLVRYLDSPGA